MFRCRRYKIHAKFLFPGHPDIYAPKLYCFFTVNALSDKTIGMSTLPQIMHLYLEPHSDPPEEQKARTFHIA